MEPVRHAKVFARSRWLSLAVLLTIGVVALLAHEGHAPLPTRGVQVDAVRGQLLLTPDARTAIDVDTVTVEVRSIEERVLAYVSVVAPWRNHAFATAGVPGRIVKVNVVPGQTIKAGEVVAEIESLELDTLQLDVLAARNDITLSEKLVAELTKSADAGAIAGQLVLDAETRLARDRNALELARSKWLGLGLPTDRLDDLLRRGEPLPGLTLPVTAQVSGTVVHAELTAGKVVEPSEHLAEVIDLSTVWVRVEVLEKDLRRVVVGQPVELHLVAYPGETFRTTVKAKSPYLDPVTNVTIAWAELANPPGTEPRFRPGMSGQGYLLAVEELPRPAGLAGVTGGLGVAIPLLGSDKPRPTIPVAAVLREGVEQFVLVEEASAAGSSEYRKVPIVVGREGGGRVEILAGNVFPGDRVVTRGGHELGPFFTPGILKLSPEAERNIGLKVERGGGLKVEPARVVAIDEVISLDGAVDVPPVRRGFAASQLAGTIRTIRVDRGQFVTSADVVAEVFSPELLTLQQELLRVHLEAALAADTLARLRKPGGGVAAQRLWELDSQLNGLKVQADTFRRKLVTAGLTSAAVDRLLISKRPVTAVPIRSPVAGVVVNFDKVLGQAVATHESLFEIHDAGQPPVKGLVSERDAGRVQVGHEVRVRFVADPRFVGTGRITRSGQTFGAENRTQAVWVELDTYPDRPLLHGQLAGLTVVLGHRPSALAVPRIAVVTEGGSSFVFVRKPDGMFDRQLVETGPADDRFITITRGLIEGESVAVAGVNELMTAFSSLR